MVVSLMMSIDELVSECLCVANHPSGPGALSLVASGRSWDLAARFLLSYFIFPFQIDF